jgi:uncharacterized protein (TIGR02118 family)
MTTTARFLVLWGTPEDPAGFEQHYREVHVPLVKQLPGLRRYTFSRNVVSIRGGDPYYRIAELDFDDLASLREAFATPAGQATAADVTTLASTAGAQMRSMTYELEDL